MLILYINIGVLSNYNTDDKAQIVKNLNLMV